MVQIFKLPGKVSNLRTAGSEPAVCTNHKLPGNKGSTNIERQSFRMLNGSPIRPLRDAAHVVPSAFEPSDSGGNRTHCKQLMKLPPHHFGFTVNRIIQPAAAGQARWPNQYLRRIYRRLLLASERPACRTQPRSHLRCSTQALASPWEPACILI